MSPEAVDEVAALGALDLQCLRQVWRSRYGAPPALRSVDLLRLCLAWRLQAQAFGGLSEETRAQLKRRGPVQAEGLSLGVGAVLSRHWQGRPVQVEVIDGGFRWNGAVYRSLSAAATAIAGTRWNGPRFFGLRESGR